MNKQIYYWNTDKIVNEYLLIQKKESKLSFRDRKTVTFIYNQKREKGALPEQKKAVKKSGEIISGLIENCLSRYLEEQGIPPSLNALKRFTLVQEKPQDNEITRFEVILLGAEIGIITIHLDSNTGRHSARFKH